MARTVCLFTGWTVRIYHNFKDEPDYQKLCQTFDAYRHVDLWNATRVLDERNLTVETFPMNWRFLPLIDENVDQFMSRDSDSLILQREVEAVGQWIQGPSTFHIIRDHPSHCNIHHLQMVATFLVIASFQVRRYWEVCGVLNSKPNDDKYLKLLHNCLKREQRI